MSAFRASGVHRQDKFLARDEDRVTWFEGTATVMNTYVVEFD